MTTQKLKRGDEGRLVSHLQMLLNQKQSGPKLSIDGRFGSKTEAAVRRFQQDHWLAIDGIVGPATWGILENREQYHMLHRVHLVPQHTSATCWSAALAMLLNRMACMSPGDAQLSSEGGLLNDSNNNHLTNTRKFARAHGLNLIPGATHTANGLYSMLLNHGPLMINLLWDVNGYVSGSGSPGHMIIVAGIRGDGTEDGATIRVYDPWPVNRGSIYSLTYGPFMRKMPASTYQIYYR